MLRGLRGYSGQEELLLLFLECCRFIAYFPSIQVCFTDYDGFSINVVI
jgi:hypothetical protein